MAIGDLKAELDYFCKMLLDPLNTYLTSLANFIQNSETKLTDELAGSAHPMTANVSETLNFARVNCDSAAASCKDASDYIKKYNESI